MVGLVRKVRLYTHYNADEAKLAVESAFKSVPELNANFAPSFRLLVITGPGNKSNTFTPWDDAASANYEAFLMYVRFFGFRLLSHPLRSL